MPNPYYSPSAPRTEHGRLCRAAVDRPAREAISGRRRLAAPGLGPRNSGRARALGSAAGILLLPLAILLLTGCATAAEPAADTGSPGSADLATALAAQPGPDSGKDFWANKGWDRPTLGTADKVSYLDAACKDVVFHLNMVRANPAQYAAAFIEPMKQYFNDKLYREPDTPEHISGIQTEEGVDAVAECVTALKKAQPAPALTPSAGLSQAAADHAADQAKSGGLGHTGSDGSNPATRAKRHGRWLHKLGENVSYGPGLARRIVACLLIDDAVPGRGHRENILKPDFKVVGVAIAKHPKYGWVCVLDFAGGFEEAGK